MKELQNQPGELIYGVVEGFYGVFYTHPERLDLIRFIGKLGYNRYIYAPKNDRQQRARWWEPYPREIMAQFRETVRVARQSGVRFGWGISPGGSICYSNAQDFTRLTDKMRAFFQIGVQDFTLMLDDNEPGFRNAIDARRYGSLSVAQASLANRLLDWLHTLNPNCTLNLVPPDYWGSAPFSAALVDLACRLHPDIDLFYTGTEICSAKISSEDARAYRHATGRKPLIWDNYPANDLSMQPELHLGPVTGRGTGLGKEVKGFLVNPMNQAEASKIPLMTHAAYWSDPRHYQPGKAWQAALKEVAGEADALALRILAENTSGDGRRLERLANAALEALKNKHGGSMGALPDLPPLLGQPPLRELLDYLTQIDEATYALKFRMHNLALRNNLLLWIEVLEHWMWMARFGLRVLEHIENGEPYLKDLARVCEYKDIIRTHPKRIASSALSQVIDFVLDQVVKDQRKRLRSARLVGRLS